MFVIFVCHFRSVIFLFLRCQIKNDILDNYLQLQSRSHCANTSRSKLQRFTELTNKQNAELEVCSDFSSCLFELKTSEYKVHSQEEQPITGLLRPDSYGIKPSDDNKHSDSFTVYNITTHKQAIRFQHKHTVALTHRVQAQSDGLLRIIELTNQLSQDFLNTRNGQINFLRLNHKPYLKKLRA